MTEPGKVVPLRPQRPCPVCGKPAQAPHGAFCSKRCADLDLGRWLSEGYRIPSAEKPDADAADESGEEDDRS
jgi:endogenous inhibitor of DNA gyrase (YacG/DUF329 family)